MPGLPLTLSYDAPPECPSQQVLEKAVENLVASGSAKPLSTRVSIRLSRGGYEASIAAADGSARVLRGSSCSEVIEGTSVVLALSITPQAPPAETKPPPKPKNAALRPRDTESTRWLLGAEGRGDIGTLPYPTLGFGGQLGVERGSWSAHATGTYWLNQRGTLTTAPSLSGNFSWWTAALRACGAPSTGALRLELCAGVELGELSGQGEGIAEPRHPKTLWAAVSASAGASWALSGGFRLRAEIGAAAPFVGRRPFVINGQLVHEPSIVSGRAEIGPEVVF